MKTLKSEPIYFFRSERNNTSKFFVGIVEEFMGVNIIKFIGVTDPYGNKLKDITAKDVRDFENGKTERIIFNWDYEYDTSYYIRESGLTDSEKEMTELF